MQVTAWHINNIYLYLCKDNTVYERMHVCVYVCVCVSGWERERERDLNSFSEAKREMKAISQPFTYKTKTQNSSQITDQKSITWKYELVNETLIIY